MLVTGGRIDAQDQHEKECGSLLGKKNNTTGETEYPSFALKQPNGQPFGNHALPRRGWRASGVT